jgi:hypothetical protein
LEYFYSHQSGVLGFPNDPTEEIQIPDGESDYEGRDYGDVSEDDFIPEDSSSDVEMVDSDSE